MRAILPPAIQKKVGPWPNIGYGRKRVVLTLQDGAEFPGVHVVWNREIVIVEEHESNAFRCDKGRQR